MLAPFLQLLFGKEELLRVEPAWTFSGASVTNHIKYVISQVIIHYDNNKVYALAFICIVILVSIFFKNLFTYLGFRVLSPMRNYVMTKLRSDLFDKILELPIGYFTEQRKGDIISRMSNDANEIEFSVMSTLEGLIREPLTVLIVLVSLVLLSPQLSFFLLVLLPATGFIIGRLSKSLKKQSTDAQERYGLLMSILDETLTGLRIIKAFNAEGLIGKRFFAVNDGLGNLRNKMNFRRDMASPVSEFLGVFVLCCILWFGGKLVLSNQADLNAEGFITYILLFTQIIQPAKNLAGSFSSARKGGAAVARIEEILQAAIVVKEPEAPKVLAQFSHSIEFKNVSFAYNDVTILKNINLTIEKGKTVALVGSSGAGKSTLADLVPRFHDVTEGELLIDGVNIKDLSLQSLRNQISIVTQEPILFNDTIASNICLGKQDATQAQIEDAAKVANAYQFILKKEEGFATNIGDRGSKLSGGERQRLTIARAVLKNPPILILDEATSSLDTESERLVQDAINNMMQNRTSIVIAHRLSTIRHADEIIVLSKGEIAERGTHDSLITKGGIYQRLVEMQEVR
ncbi:ABC transporter ATP-binding protein [Parasediminibacterium paludis]|uniref:ABC transporter ATP-binding protein n=1 Tax=Parasediminibacterium paludis TaxID=908966 RepID=A0ABV8PY80_9BACT